MEAIQLRVRCRSQLGAENIHCAIYLIHFQFQQSLMFKSSFCSQSVSRVLAQELSQEENSFWRDVSDIEVNLALIVLVHRLLVGSCFEWSDSSQPKLSKILNQLGKILHLVEDDSYTENIYFSIIEVTFRFLGDDFRSQITHCATLVMH